MGKDNHYCCDKTHGDGYHYHLRRRWTNAPYTTYNDEPDYLSADVYNKLIEEMERSVSIMAKRGDIKQSLGKDDSYKRDNRRPYTFATVIPPRVSTGTKFSAADWNNTCNQIAALIADARRIPKEDFDYARTEGSEPFRVPTIPVSENNAHAVKYSAGEVIKASKRITDLINIVRRARLTCTCDSEAYVPCNDCRGHTCIKDKCCDARR